MRRADNAENRMKLDIYFIKRRDVSKSFRRVGGCVIEVQKLLVRVETEEWVYEAFELS